MEPGFFFVPSVAIEEGFQGGFSEAGGGLEGSLGAVALGWGERLGGGAGGRGGKGARVRAKKGLCDADAGAVGIAIVDIGEGFGERAQERKDGGVGLVAARAPVRGDGGGAPVAVRLDLFLYGHG